MRTTSMSYRRRPRRARAKIMMVVASLSAAATGAIGIAAVGSASAQASTAKSGAAAVVQTRASSVDRSSADHGENRTLALSEPACRGRGPLVSRHLVSTDTVRSAAQKRTPSRSITESPTRAARASRYPVTPPRCPADSFGGAPSARRSRNRAGLRRKRPVRGGRDRPLGRPAWRARATRWPRAHGQGCRRERSARNCAVPCGQGVRSREGPRRAVRGNVVAGSSWR